MNEKVCLTSKCTKGKLVSGKCSSGKVLTSAHLARLTNERNQGVTGGAYWYDICEK